MIINILNRNGYEWQKKRMLIISDIDIQKYLNGETALSISNRINCSASAVINALKRQGIKIRGLSEANKIISQDKLKESAEKLRKSGKMSILLSAGHQKIKVDQWVEFSSTKNNRERYSDEWKEWRTSVFTRDNFTCMQCKCKSTRTNSLHPHHIKKRSSYPDLKYDINNGITLCAKCHVLTFNKEEKLEEYFKNLIKNKL